MKHNVILLYFFLLFWDKNKTKNALQHTVCRHTWSYQDRTSSLTQTDGRVNEFTALNILILQNGQSDPDLCWSNSEASELEAQVRLSAWNSGKKKKSE